jgi:hypothetical protein
MGGCRHCSVGLRRSGGGEADDVPTAVRTRRRDSARDRRVYGGEPRLAQPGAAGKEAGASAGDRDRSGCAGCGVSARDAERDRCVADLRDGGAERHRYRRCPPCLDHRDHRFGGRGRVPGAMGQCAATGRRARTVRCPCMERAGRGAATDRAAAARRPPGGGGAPGVPPRRSERAGAIRGVDPDTARRGAERGRAVPGAGPLPAQRQPGRGGTGAVAGAGKGSRGGGGAGACGIVLVRADDARPQAPGQ